MPTNNAWNTSTGTTGQLMVAITGQAGSYADSASADFTFTTATAGATRTLTVSNTDNSNASSNAKITQTVGGASAGDPFHTFTVTGGGSGSVGIDNSDSDRLKLSYSTALGTADTVIIDATGGQYKGYGTNTAPAAGFIGESISSTVAPGSAVSVSNNTPTNITSISLTAGIWDVACILTYSSGSFTGTNFEATINTTSATRGTLGDNTIQTPTVPTSGASVSIVIPRLRLALSTTQTVYMIAYAQYTVGTATAYGRLSATRVG